MSAPAQAQTWPTCTIVTNGRLHIYWHEVAHCNGWQHEPFLENIQPPRKYVYPYKGKLIHIVPEWGETVLSICQKFWRERGIVVTASNMDRLVGCTLK